MLIMQDFSKMYANKFKNLFSCSLVNGGSRDYLIFLVFTWIAYFGDQLGILGVGMLVGFVYNKVYLRFGDSRLIVFFRILSFGIGFSSGLSAWVPLCGRYLMLFDQKMLPDRIMEITEECVSRIDKSILANLYQLAVPIVGSNNSLVPEALKRLYDEAMVSVTTMLEDTTIKSLMDYSVKAEYLRPNDVSRSAVDLCDKPFLESRDVYVKAVNLTNYQRMMVWTVSIIFSVLIFRSPYLLAIFLVYMVVRGVEAAQVRTGLGKRGALLKNGVYQIGVTAFSLPISHGIGVVYNGIMHTPYHVSCGDDIVIGACVYPPYYVNIEEDLVTYGGPPQFLKPKNCNEVFVNCETKGSRTSYKVRVATEDGSRLLSWHGVSKPGESGSPVFAYDGEKLILIGLAGRYYRDVDGVVTEYANVPYAGHVPEVKESLRKIVTHPGSGKTFRKIPELVADYMMENKKRVLVTGPTRVVCKEIMLSLKRHFRVGMNVKDEQHLRDVYAPVQVAAHASAIKMLLEGSRELRGLGLIVIDEAHFDDANTIMLRNYAKFLSDEGIEVVEMSATLDGEMDSRSNFKIEDHPVSKAEAINLARSEVEEGRKTLVFVPSLNNSSVKMLTQGLVKSSVCKLSRGTFVEEAPRVNDPEVMMVISTDISECGINIDNLVNVVDLSEKFGYVVEGNCVVGKKYAPDHPSVIQRRGRIGRKQEGHYWYVRPPSEEKILTSAQLDASIMMTGRKWAHRVSNPFGLFLTDEQLKCCIDKNLNPTWTWLATNHLGKAISNAELTRRIDEVRGGTAWYIGCENRDCSCVGKWKWYDDRNHPKMVGLFKFESNIDV